MPSTWHTYWDYVIRDELSERIDSNGTKALRAIEIEQILEAVKAERERHHIGSLHDAMHRAICKAAEIYLPDEKPHFPQADGMNEATYWWMDYQLRCCESPGAHVPGSYLWCLTKLNVNGDPIVSTLARVGCLWQGISPKRAFGYAAAESYGEAVSELLSADDPRRNHPPDRDGGAPWSRLIIWDLCSIYTNLSYEDMGVLFGDVQAARVRQALSKSGRERDPLRWRRMMDDIYSLTRDTLIRQDLLFDYGDLCADDLH